MESTQKLQNGKFSLHKEVELPIDGLPELVQQYINEIVRVYHCPIEFPTVAVIAAFATAIGKRIKVTDGKYTNPLMLWFINVAPSGSNKTQPVKEVLKPLREINRKNYQVFDAEYRAWKADKERDESNPPMFNQILVSDTTDEARNKIFQSTSTGIVGHYPEFKGFLDDQERYNKGGYIDKLLRLFDYEDIYINRKGDEKPLVITDAFMCILGDIQPALLAPTFGNPQYMVSGLNTRFLFTMPKIFEFPDREKESMNPCFVESWRSIIRQAYENDYTKIPTIWFSPESDALYDCYFNSLQQKKEKVSSTTGDGYLLSLYSKLQIQTMRFAGIVHLMGMINCTNSYNNYLVSGESMEYTIRCMEYFEQSAVAVYELIQGIAPNSSKEMTQADILRMVKDKVGIKNQRAFAEGIGKDPSYVSRILK